MKTVDLSIEYAGLKLKNPLIVSSSELTNSIDNIKLFAESGAGAIVLKSLFEEKIMMQINQEMQTLDSNYPEAQEYLQAYSISDQLETYLKLIRDSKAACEIPIIASINCYTRRNWISFAREIEKAGADALEINIMYIDTDPEWVHGKCEMMHIDILRDLKKIIQIPIIMKLSRQFTNPVSLINQLQHNGAAAVVLFNRSYVPDIDIQTLTFTSGPVLSDVSSFYDTFRWVGIVAGILPQVCISASGGIHTGTEMIKAILAGAQVAQICSSLYKKGAEVIPFILTELMIWMQDHSFHSIDQFKGKLNHAHIDQDQNHFIRTQFMKYFATAQELRN